MRKREKVPWETSADILQWFLIVMTITFLIAVAVEAEHPGLIDQYLYKEQAE